MTKSSTPAWKSISTDLAKPLGDVLRTVAVAALIAQALPSVGLVAVVVVGFALLGIFLSYVTLSPIAQAVGEGTSEWIRKWFKRH